MFRLKHELRFDKLRVNLFDKNKVEKCVQGYILFDKN